MGTFGLVGSMSLALGEEIAISFVFAWMRLKSGSLWTGALLHASHNLYVQTIFTPPDARYREDVVVHRRVRPDAAAGHHSIRCLLLGATW